MSVCIEDSRVTGRWDEAPETITPRTCWEIQAAVQRNPSQIFIGYIVPCMCPPLQGTPTKSSMYPYNPATYLPGPPLESDLSMEPKPPLQIHPGKACLKPLFRPWYPNSPHHNHPWYPTSPHDNHPWHPTSPHHIYPELVPAFTSGSAPGTQPHPCTPVSCSAPGVPLRQIVSPSVSSGILPTVNSSGSARQRTETRDGVSVVATGSFSRGARQRAMGNDAVSITQKLGTSCGGGGCCGVSKSVAFPYIFNLFQTGRDPAEFNAPSGTQCTRSLRCQDVLNTFQTGSLQHSIWEDAATLATRRQLT